MLRTNDWSILCLCWVLRWYSSNPASSSMLQWSCVKGCVCLYWWSTGHSCELAQTSFRSQVQTFSGIYTVALDLWHLWQCRPYWTEPWAYQKISTGVQRGTGSELIHHWHKPNQKFSDELFHIPICCPFLVTLQQPLIHYSINHDAEDIWYDWVAPLPALECLLSKSVIAGKLGFGWQYSDNQY